MAGMQQPLSQAQIEAQRFRQRYDEMQAQQPLQEMAVSPESPAIGVDEVRKAAQTFLKYRSGKSQLDSRVIQSEQWWKLRHWDYMNAGNALDARPASSWLFNLIMSKHADALEAYPEPNILPREPDDKQTAKLLTACVPVVLEQNDFEQTYDAKSWQKLIQGTGIYGIFWDKDKLNGMGDVGISKIDVLNIFWEPGITDIQKSRNVFTIELVDRDVLTEMYADALQGRSITGQSISPNKYLYDDNVPTEDKAVVVDWYYHKTQGGRRVLHYCKFVDEIVLYATENDPELRERGLYDHGMYPFVFDALFPIEGSPCGYGYIDIGKNVQARIDALNQAIDKHAMMGANPRFFIRDNGGVNETEFSDWTKPFVHTTGTLGDDSIRPIQIASLESNYINVLNNMVVELKETTGNRDASNGGADSGVTAASAIAALQEQAGKTSKASNRRAYMAYRQLVMMVIELIRQFYELPRQFRIAGKGAEEEYVSLTNQLLQPQPLNLAGVDMGYRLPIFDIEVSAQKMSVYTKVTQNELALQLFKMGVLAPQNADQSLALLDIMDFPHKDQIEEKVRQNGTMYTLLTQMQQIAMTLAVQAGRADVAESLAQSAMQTQQGLSGGMVDAKKLTTPPTTDATTGKVEKEPTHMMKARERSQNTSQPTA